MTELQLDNSLTGDADANADADIIKAMATTTTTTNITATDTTTNITTPKATAKRRQFAEGESEEGFLSTSPDSANGDAHAHGLGHTMTHSQTELKQSGNGGSGSIGGINGSSSEASNGALSSRQLLLQAFYQCSASDQCVKLDNILNSFKAPLSEDQAWALVYQFTSLYHKVAVQAHRCTNDDYEAHLPRQFELHLHRDGSVHFSGKDQQPQQQQKNGDEKEQESRSETDSMSTLKPQPLDDSASSSGDSSSVINRGEFCLLYYTIERKEYFTKWGNIIEGVCFHILRYY